MGPGEDEPVVLEIGMAWRSLWRLVAHPWVPRSAVAMARDDTPELVRTWVSVSRRGPILAQRWRSRRELESWAVRRGATHQAPMARFAAQATGTVAWGIWHVLRPVEG